MHTADPPPLKPRHQAFAAALASGLPPSAAYREAGYSAKNSKARALALRADPTVASEVVTLQTLRLEQWHETVCSGSQPCDDMQRQAGLLIAQLLRIRCQELQKPPQNGDLAPHGDRMGMPNPHPKSLILKRLIAKMGMGIKK
jgi:hypothetical protein